MDSVAQPIAMFPLTQVCLPGSDVTLRIFEARYRVLAQELTRGMARFGTVLISRGSEVGGSDLRFRVGTLLRAVELNPLRSGNYIVSARAEERIDVQSWLPDDPYPVALVTSSPLTESERPVDTAELQFHLDELRRRVTERRLALLVPAFESYTDAATEVLIWRIMALLPIGEMERQGILESFDLEELVRRSSSAVRSLIEILEAADNAP